MPARKMRVELFDSEGNKYTVAFEGQITRDKAVRLLDLVELLGGVPNDAANAGLTLAEPGNDLSKYAKVRAVISKHFPLVWFSSREVQTLYEQEYKEPATLSTVATYLTRMTTKGLLLKTGPSNSLKYKLAPAVPQVTVKQKIRQ